MGKIEIFRVLSYLFPIFWAGPISGSISGAIFSLFRAGGPKPLFLPGRRVLNTTLSKCLPDSGGPEGGHLKRGHLKMGFRSEVRT